MVRLLVAICMQKYYANFRTYLANHKENIEKVPNAKEREEQARSRGVVGTRSCDLVAASRGPGKRRRLECGRSLDPLWPTHGNGDGD